MPNQNRNSGNQGGNKMDKDEERREMGNEGGRKVEDERWAERGSSETSAFDAVADRADLLAALQQLPERQRTIVVARYYYGLSYDEIASHFDIKSGTVGATLHQAIEKLRQTQMAGRLARGAMR